MKVILTLLCRDEEDILESLLRFHLANGVDHVIATDNGSVDRSLSILQHFERIGKLELIQVKEHNYDQAIWVTHMARLAAKQGADWVINSDADEFWWPTSGNLKTNLKLRSSLSSIFTSAIFRFAGSRRNSSSYMDVSSFEFPESEGPGGSPKAPT